MKIMVLDKLARHNLALFKHLLHRQAEKTARYFQVARKTYNAYVHTKTGELRFEELERDVSISGENWYPIVIQLRPDSEGAFEILATESGNAFDCSKLEEEAYRMLTRTMHILNQVSYDPKQGKNPFWVLRHVAHIDFLLPEKEGEERNQIESAWHPCDREKAEALLEDQEPGAYLFRKDEFACLLEDTINEARSKPVTCLTLTFRDWESKISEKTLVYCDEKWMFFNDDLELKGPRFESIKELLESVGDQVSYPLPASEQ